MKDDGLKTINEIPLKKQKTSPLPMIPSIHEYNIAIDEQHKKQKLESDEEIQRWINSMPESTDVFQWWNNNQVDNILMFVNILDKISSII